MCVDVLWILTSDAGSTPATSTIMARIAAVFNLYVEKSGYPKSTHFDNIEKGAHICTHFFGAFDSMNLERRN